MTTIEELLRTSLADAPTPVTEMVDPFADLSRRVGRAQRRRAMAAVVITTLLVAAIVVPLSLVGNGRTIPVSQGPKSTSAIQRLPFHNVEAVAAGGGASWMLQEVFGRSNSHGVVSELDAGLHIVARFRVPEPVDSMAYGAGRVWAWGGGDGAYPSGYLTAIDPASRRSTRVLVGHGVGVYAMAFQGRAVWAIEKPHGVLTRIRLKSGAPQFGRSLPAPEATGLVAGHGRVLATSAKRTVASSDYWSLPPGASHPSAVLPAGRVIAAVPGGFLSTRHGALLVEDGVSRQVGAAYPARIAYAQAVVRRTDGAVFVVATTRLEDGTLAARLLQYTAARLGEGADRPVAEHAAMFGQVGSIAPDQGGGLLIETLGHQRLYRWTPAG